jgi:hypothetical protein
MKVRIFGGGSEELGATRFQIEWITVKPSAQDNDGIDPDTDTLTHHEYRNDKDAAMLRAQELFNSTENLCWGVVTVRKPIVDWFSEEERVAGWEDTDEETDILTENDYAQYMAAKTPPSS